MDSHKPILPRSDSSGQCFLNQGEQKHVEKTDQSEEQHPDERLLKASGRDDAFQPWPVQHKQIDQRQLGFPPSDNENSLILSPACSLYGSFLSPRREPS